MSRKPYKKKKVTTLCEDHQEMKDGRFRLICENLDCRKTFYKTRAEYQNFVWRTQEDPSLKACCCRKCTISSRESRRKRRKILPLEGHQEMKDGTFEMVCANPACGETFYKTREQYQNFLWRASKKHDSDKETKACCSKKCSGELLSIVGKEILGTRLVMLICANPDCGKKFKRHLGRHKSNTLNNIRQFCSVACRAACTPTFVERDDDYNLRRIFQVAKSRAKRRKNQDVKITPEYLKEVWDEQKGICPLTGIKLDLNQRSRMDPEYGTGDEYLHSASLDRIDSTKGYEEGNVRFVSLPVNVALGKMSDAQFIEMCRLVVACAL